ncbi:uncharacterized protein F5891DRAFT_1195184 [Suillus fuscotomentosus]|uniref:Uncharacterized protein n=1 Tax=Suillus fuscotomentosus TaxID=1912939 RepID=A0AAD4HFP2_9AGAM|nr:uncharacterized protein F5891DRAFT_1195184 [Suillus fuscotomentosus]KAG1894476.1 hypothetical protein F5891DRAFT_1195184 [Suillus fuscotomentosus]
MHHTPPTINAPVDHGLLLRTSVPSYALRHKFRNYQPQDFHRQPAMLSQPLPPLQSAPAISMTKNFCSETLFVLAKGVKQHNVLCAAHGGVAKAWESVAKDLRGFGVDVSERTLRSKLDALLEWHVDPKNCPKSIQDALKDRTEACNMHEVLDGFDNLPNQRRVRTKESEKSKENNEESQCSHRQGVRVPDLTTPVKRSHRHAMLTDEENEIPVECAKRVKCSHDCNSDLEVQFLALLALEHARNDKTDALIEQVTLSTEACLKAVENTQQQLLAFLRDKSMPFYF